MLREQYGDMRKAYFKSAFHLARITSTTHRPQHAVPTLQDTVNSTQHQHALCCTQHALHSTPSTARHPQHAFHNSQYILHTLHSTLHALHSTQHILHSTLHALHSTHHALHSTQQNAALLYPKLPPATPALYARFPILFAHCRVCSKFTLTLKLD